MNVITFHTSAKTSTPVGIVRKNSDVLTISINDHSFDVAINLIKQVSETLARKIYGAYLSRNSADQVVAKINQWLRENPA
jgi:bifunctional pyridoxal-dependent enzyme with beta-cystathionase and maltose regulon repressor activities